MGNIVPILVLVIVSSYFFFWNDTFQPETIRNQRVLVTGASSGIGEELAYQYSRLGARLVITARREELLRKVASKCKELGASSVELVAADMTVQEDRDKVIRFTGERLGGLDYLILNHATLRHAAWTGHRENLTFLHQDMEVNFVSYVDLASKAIDMLSASSGHIGVVSSVCGKMSCSLMTQYTASKFALHGFFTSLRQELNARRVNVTITMCVLGLIDTENAMRLIKENLPTMDTWIAAPAQDCAQAIVEQVGLGVYEMHFPRMAMFYDYVHRFFPEFLENYAGRQIHQFQK